MRLKKLGNTGLLVSEICLGTMTFGSGEGLWRAIGRLEQPAVAGARAGVDQKQAITGADQEPTDIHEPPAALYVVGMHLELR